MAQAAKFAFRNHDKSLVYLSHVKSQNLSHESQKVSRVFFNLDLIAISSALDLARAHDQIHFTVVSERLISEKRDRMQAAETWEAWEQAGGSQDLRDLSSSLAMMVNETAPRSKLHAPKATKRVGSECKFNASSTRSFDK